MSGARPWQKAWFAPLVALVLVYSLFAILSPETFARTQNLAVMARQTVVVAIAAVGMTLVIIHGGIDLSVGSGVALTTVVVAKALKAGAGPGTAALAGIAVAAFAGLCNGLLVTRLRLAPFIVTLASMRILRGVAKGLAGEQKIDADPRGLDALTTPGGGVFALVPPGVLIALLLALACAGVLTYTRFGRHVYAVGSNEATARLAGVSVPGLRVLVYTLAAALTGVAGVMEFATLTVGDPTDSGGLELEVIAAVVIGGASLSGGVGSISGTLVGAVLMTVIKTGCTHLGLSNWVQEILTGIIIAVAVAFDRVRRDRRLQGASPMRLSAIVSAAAGCCCLFACGAAAPPPDRLAPRPMTSSAVASHDFESDVAFLAAHGSVVVLEAPSGGRVAVSPTYQGRVMTSAVAPGGESLGFLHRAFIETGKTGTPFDNYGGEDRFWLGPEGGQFGLYFPKDAPFTFEAWQTPAAFQEGTWEISHRAATSVGFARSLAVTSHAGVPFKLDVTREIDVLSAEAVVAHLGIALSDRVKWVAFESKNAIRNTGAEGWKEETGLVSIWILGMFAPAADAKVILPFVRGAAGPIVNDAYFGKIPGDRLKVDEGRGVVVFSADGKQRGKIGLGPARAQAVAGSYSASARLLTIVQYDKPVGATRYVNSMWETQREPYAGDVLNSYNDGPPAPGKPSLGGFYELETSSPAAALAPGKSLAHAHRTFHFVGAPADLESIAQKVLGVSLAAAE